jgi:hypothetical protein
MQKTLTLFSRFFFLLALCFIGYESSAQYVHSYSFPTAAGVGFRMTEPAAYTHSYHVKKTGNDNNPGTADLPLLTVGKALEKAKVSLQGGNKTKILVYPGTYGNRCRKPPGTTGTIPPSGPCSASRGKPPRAA